MIQGIEPVIDGLVKRLQDELPAIVTQVNSEHTDGVAIKPPDKVLDHVPPVETLFDTPLVGVAEGPQRFEDDIGSSATGISEIIVVCYVQSDDQQTLVTHLRRWRTALLRGCLPATRTIPHATTAGVNAAWAVNLVRVEPGQTLGEMEAEQVRSWLSWVRLVLEARHDEEWS